MAKIKINTHQTVPPGEIRHKFANAMSDMYRFEVPQYGSLLDMVKQINQQQLDNNPALQKTLTENLEIQRLNTERHGAIRLGKAQELFNMRRLFAVMGMYPVGYYDLTEGGLPVHSTAFRPVQLDELKINPFRVFTSLLRIELIQDEKLRTTAEQLLSSRQIFSDNLLQLIHSSEQNNGLNVNQAQQFVAEALQTFRWHHQATVNLPTYQQFLQTHNLIADIVCFKGPHINHLTPRTLNIDDAQQAMSDYGLQAKAIIEGPPARKYPILLRQTSFKALAEDIEFPDKEKSQQGSHTARFGEIEQRGMALTPKGRNLYDQLLNRVRQLVPDAANNQSGYYQQLAATFEQFPDDLEQLHHLRLAYFSYSVNPHKTSTDFNDLNTLVDQQQLLLYPVTYEDFLPVSAAGIFQSNLTQQQSRLSSGSANQQLFETQLGEAVLSEFDIYQQLQSNSLRRCLQQLRIKEEQQQYLLGQLTGSS